MTDNLSNVQYLTVLDPIGLERIGWEAVAVSPHDWQTPLAYVSRFQQMMLQRVKNDVGAGSIVIDSDDPILHDPLPSGFAGTVLDRECLWRFYEDGVARFEWLGEDVAEDEVKDDESRTTTISGRTTEKVLEWGVAVPGNVTVQVPDPKAKKPAGWDEAHPGPTANVAEKRIEGHLARLWIGAHGFTKGDTAIVAGVGTDFNGKPTITKVGTDWIEYRREQPDVVRQASAGTVKGPVVEWAAPLIWVEQQDPMAFTDVPGIDAFRWLMDSLQARDVLPFVTLLFDAATDSKGQAWRDSSDVQIEVGETPLALLMRLADSLGWEFRMLPGFRLFIAQDGTGAHREEEVVCHVGGVEQQHTRQATTRELATKVYAQAQNKDIAIAAGASDASPWTREMWLEAGDAKKISGAQRVANAALAAVKDRKVGREVKVLADSPYRHLFVDFDVNDWITVEDEALTRQAIQVLGATLTVDADARVDLELAIQTKFEARAVRLAKTLAKMGAGSSSSDASKPIRTSSVVAASMLDDLADVEVSYADPNDVLTWNGSQWVPRTPGQITDEAAMAINTLADVDTASTAPAVGDALLWNGTNWVPGVVAGGGGGGASRYWVALMTDLASGTVPTTDTLVSGMTLTIPASVSARMAFVDFDVVFTGAHTNRFSVWLNGALKTKPITGVLAGANTTYSAAMSRVPIALPGGSTAHTLEVRWNASDSTAAVTFNNRIMVADVAVGSASPVTV